MVVGMAGVIAFDYERALDRATRLFWKNGYAGTSLRDLLKVMGIGEGSFYNTLKSKKRLFLECLKRYDETEGRKRSHALMSAPTASLGIRALFASVLDTLDSQETPSRLCMFAAMATEEVLSDRDLRRRIEDRMEGYQVQLVERLNQDQDAGLLPAELDLRTTASVIVTYQQGIWRMALLEYDRTRFDRQTDVFLTALGL
jgi:TetR/AcrR family transcriptional regulator, transcriptional repressor for nem operon